MDIKDVNSYGELTWKGFYSTHAAFKADLDAGKIPTRVVAFIADTQQVYVRGAYFHCKEILGDNVILNSYGIPEGYDGTEIEITKDDVISAAIAKLNRQILNNEKTTAAMGVDLSNKVSDPLPVHTVLAAPASITNPFGSKWLPCDGSQVLALDYPDLVLTVTSGYITLPTVTDSAGVLTYYIKVLK